MTPSSLFQQMQAKKSYLCVGLDSDPARIPAHLQSEKDPVFAFNRAIIEATLPYAVAYKPNLAFYEAQGPRGWESLAKTLELIPNNVFTIADAKRGDIGNTSRLYAKTFFETYDFDAVTVAPYMGEDSVAPFLEFEGKWVFLLALTSNPSAQDFQHLPTGQGPLHERVILKAEEWAQRYPGQLGYVVGATRSESLRRLRELIPQATLLVPGVGAQGGDLHAVCQHGPTELGGLLVNSSRGIIFASEGEDFAEAAAASAKALQQEMSQYF
ncbi:MAG: orotidine-5'-phosphate decarboxylase [Bacteroidota bacterium]